MPYDRLIADFDREEGWAAFRRAGGPSGESLRAMFQVRKGFSRDDVLEAARGTGWVVDREGDLWIDSQIACETLAGFVREMLDYFDEPGKPSRQLIQVQRFVQECLAAESDEEISLSPWVCAWLDLVIRDDAKDDVLAANDVWQTDVLQVDLRKHRTRRVHQVLERLLGTAGPAEAGKMAPSRRWRRASGRSGKEAG